MQDIFAQKYTYEKLTIYLNFTCYLPEKYFPYFWGRGDKCPCSLISTSVINFVKI